MIKSKVRSFWLLIIMLIVIYSFSIIDSKDNASEIIKPTYSALVLGDVTGDGKVGINDVSKLYRGYKGIIKLTDDEKNIGDIIYDGEVKINDVSKLYRYVKGVVPKLVTTQVTSLHYYDQTAYSYVSMCSGNNTVANSGCGVASFAMIATSYSDGKFNPQYVASWFCNNYYNYTDGALSHLAITSKALDHFGLQAKVLFDKTSQYNYNNYNFGTTYNSAEGIAILRAVKSGRSVMFGLPGHWSVIGPNSSCTENQVYFYNVNGYKSYMNGCYTPEQLFYDTYNYSNRCTNTGWCGWDYAIAFSSK